jgi:hypothetical protein
MAWLVFETATNIIVCLTDVVFFINLNLLQYGALENNKGLILYY